MTFIIFICKLINNKNIMSHADQLTLELMPLKAYLYLYLGAR